MAHSPLLTLDLARRIERHIGTGAFRDLLNPKNIGHFGQTIATKANGGQPRNKVFCFSSVDLPHLDAILEFYRVDQLAPTFYLTPASFNRDVSTALTAVGFSQQACEQAILYGVPDESPSSLAAHLRIEPVSTENADAYVTTLADGLEWDPAWRDRAMQDVRSKLADPSDDSRMFERLYRFLAYCDGEPAGVGALGMRDGIGSMSAGGVIPRFRNRGVHTALIHHRLHAAHAFGAELIISTASYGSASFRNQLRAGLRLAYIENEWSATASPKRPK